MAMVLVTVSNWLLFPGDESPPDEDDAAEGPLDEALLKAWVVFRDRARVARDERAPVVASREMATSRRRSARAPTGREPDIQVIR